MRYALLIGVHVHGYRMKAVYTGNTLVNSLMTFMNGDNDSNEDTFIIVIAELFLQYVPDA